MKGCVAICVLVVSRAPRPSRGTRRRRPFGPPSLASSGQAGFLMRIGIDARELSGEATGVGRYLQRLLHEWARLGGARQFLLYSPDGRVAMPAGLAGEIVLVPGAGNSIWEQTKLAAAVHRDRPDVLFAPGYTAPLLSGCPFVVTIHDVSFAAHPEWFRYREGARRRWLAGAAARRARRVLTVSEFSKAEIVSHLGVAASRVRVVRHGVGLTAHAALPREPLVLYVGSVFNRRHVPVLIQAFGQLARRRPDVRLEIVGANRTWPYEDLEALANATGAAGQIGLRDFVPDHELSRLYGRAMAFVFLSEYEGFGLTPREALGAGVPAVVLDTPVAREIYGDAAIRVAGPDPDLVLAALEQVLEPGPVRTEQLSRAQVVLARYRWDEAAAATLAILEEAAG
jgi:glycosyltransferase involved in cell wall biosynthesis